MRYIFGEWILDTHRAELCRAGHLQRLRRQPFQGLAYLLAQGDRVVSKQELCAQVWSQPFVSDAALESVIKAVRRALGDTGRTQQFIRTVYGQGYRWGAPVTTATPAPVAPARAPTLQPGSASFGRWARAAPIVGREGELAQLSQWWARAQDGERYQTIRGIVVSGQAREDVMDSTRIPHRRTLMGLIVVCLLATASALTFGGQSALAAPPGCKTVRGHFFPSQIEGDGNPNTLEFTGPVTGALAGTFLSTELVLFPGRPETPSVMLFTEILTFTTQHGTVLKTTGVGSFDTDPNATGLFTEILTIIAKDGQAGQFGQLFVFGSFDFAQNIGCAEYNGEVCD